MGSPIGLRFAAARICFGFSSSVRRRFASGSAVRVEQRAINALAALVQPLLPALSLSPSLAVVPCGAGVCEGLKAKMWCVQAMRALLSAVGPLV